MMRTLPFVQTWIDDPNRILLSYCMDLGNRDWLIKITADGVGHWLDAKDRIPPLGDYTEGEALLLWSAPLTTLREGTDPGIISVKLPEDVFLWLRAKAHAFKLEMETEADLEQLDAMLETVMREKILPLPPRLPRRPCDNDPVLAVLLNVRAQLIKNN